MGEEQESFKQVWCGLRLWVFSSPHLATKGPTEAFFFINSDLQLAKFAYIAGEPEVDSGWVLLTGVSFHLGFSKVPPQNTCALHQDLANSVAISPCLMIPPCLAIPA